MKLRKFETKIRRDLLRFSFLIIFVMVIITLITVFFFNRHLQHYRVNVTMAKYEEEVTTLFENQNEQLYVNEAMIFQRFLNNELDASHLFSAFYRYNANQKIKSDLLVYDPEFKLLLHTNPVFENDNRLVYFLQLVMTNISANEAEDAIRVFQGRDQPYLLHLHPIKQDEALLGYSVALIEGREFQLLREGVIADFVMTDQYRNILVSSQPKIKDVVTGKLNEEELMDEGHLFKKSNYVHAISNPVDHIFIITYIQKQNYTVVFLSSLVVLFAFSGGIFVQSGILAKRISTKIGRSLYSLYDELMLVRESFPHEIKLQTDDEFEDLADYINDVLNELEEAHKRNLDLKELNMMSERRKLAAQFHPHFLANTLETIRSAIYIDPHIAEELLIRMNDILRYSITDSYVDLPLSDDLVYIENYLKINQLRYDEFNYHIHVDAEVNQLMIPKLLLLPLIENSIKYGFKTRRDLTIKLSIRKSKADTVKIRVIDNGNLLSAQAVKELNAYLAHTKEITRHHGLLNTKQRIELLYPHSTFRLKSKCGFTIVEMTIPGGKYV